MNAELRPTRRLVEGWVVSDKMNKTRVIAIRWSKREQQYEKVMNLTTKLYAHDEKNESKMGDRVRLMEIRPLSRTKRWLVTDILTKKV
ncbi:MAG: 30S ribosomal protein S17 [Elusimicrobiota bacterium]